MDIPKVLADKRSRVKEVGGGELGESSTRAIGPMNGLKSLDVSKVSSPSTFNLPQVHSSRRPSNVSTLQSLLHRAPKLYQYSPDQMEVIVLRRTGEVENISYKSTRNRKRLDSAQDSQYTQAYKEVDSESSPLNSIKDSSLPTFHNAELKHDDGIVLENGFTCSSSEVTLDSLSIDETLSAQFVPNPVPRPTLCKETNTEVDSCISCNVLQTQLRTLELELTDLRQSLDFKEAQLQRSQQRITEITSQNFKLKVAASGMRKGLTHLSKIIKTSNEYSEANDRRISDLLDRSLPKQ